MAMPTLEDILRDRIKELEEEIKTQDEIIDGLKDDLKCYEDAEEQGLLIKLPCKAGDIVYEISPRRDKAIPCVVPNLHVIARWIEDKVFGSIIFLTREEAEEALKEGR